MCVWLNQQKYNLVQLIKLVTKRRNNMERRNILIEMSERSSLTLYHNINFSWDKKLCMECCARKGIKRVSMFVSRRVGTERNQKSKS
jgi:hypothetical protein